MGDQVRDPCVRERISTTKEEVEPKIMKGSKVPEAKGRIKNITTSRKVNKSMKMQL